VAFEPTPGRGQPGAEDYTDVAPAQPEVPTTPDSTVPGATTPAPGVTTPAPAPAEPPAATADDEPGPSVASRLLHTAFVMLLLLPLVAVAAVPMLRQAIRRRRRLAATTPPQRVLVAWDEAEEDLAATGLGQQRWETAAEYSARVGPVGGETVWRSLGVLTADAEAAAWSGGGVGPEVAVRAEETAAALGSALRAEATPLRRATRALDPRPLLRTRSRRR